MTQRIPGARRTGTAATVAFLLLAAWSVTTAAPAAAFGTSQPLAVPSISAGGYVSCGIQTDSTVACWGENGVPSNDVANVQPGGAATPPPGTFLEVNAGYATVCGVRTDQTLVCWGSSRFDKRLVPPGRFTHVAPGLNYVCALRTDGTIACWGGDDPAAPGADPDQKVVRDVPAGQFTQVTMGNRHACALRADGSIKCWGHNADGQINVPGGNDVPGLYRYVNVSNFSSCALKMDNSPICWGRNQGGQQTYPAGATFTQLSTGFAHVCGLRPDRTATCWGRNGEGQTVVPAGTYTQVTAGTFHTCAVPESGPPARCWGNNQSGRVQPILSAIAPHKGYVGSPYSFQFTMSTSTNSTLGGLAGISPAPSYTLAEGSLPPGMTLSPSGLLSGTPGAAGTSTFKVAASNGLSPPDCVNPSVGTNLSLGCRPGDSTSTATATRVFTVEVSSEVPQPGSIAGRVTATSTSAPVGGATVTITHSGGSPAGQATTDSDGNYIVPDLLPGPYNVTASGTELQPQTKQVTVTENQITPVDFALGPLVRPTVKSVWNNHYETVTDGLFVEWSEVIQPGLGDPMRISRYTIHSEPACAGPAIATGAVSNWTGARPRTRDIVMNGWENVVEGSSYFLRVEPETELGTETQQRNALACVSFVASLSPTDRSSVTGKVTSAATGAGIAGATVTVTRTIGAPGTAAGQAATDTNGDYRVDKLAPGPYTVTASAPGHISQSRSATTAAVAPTKRSFALKAVPVANGDTYTHYGSDTALVVAPSGVLANDTDADGDPLTSSLVTGPARGTALLNADGSFTYQPNEDHVGSDSFTYRVNDGTADSNVATVTVTVGAGCRGQQATITGTSGADRLTGTPGADVFAALGGNDKVGAAEGNDVICAGSGNDTVNAGAGDDEADGGSGDDSLKGDVGNDTLTGGAGSDAVFGAEGADVLAGGTESADSCQGGDGTDSLVAQHGCEKVNGVP